MGHLRRRGDELVDGGVGQRLVAACIGGAFERLDSAVAAALRGER